MPAVLVLALLVGQPPKVTPVPKIEPGYTAFPDVKPPPSWFNDPLYKTDPGAARAKYNKAMDELIWKDFPPLLPHDATTLQKVQREQARAAQQYIQQMKVLIETGRWSSSDLQQFTAFAAEAFRVAAELVPTPAGRVRYYESRVILLKEIEQFTELRVTTGSDPPQNLSSARFTRLQAEVELLKLKESLKGGK